MHGRAAARRRDGRGGRAGACGARPSGRRSRRGGWDAGGWDPRLFEACLSRSQTLAQPETFSDRYPTVEQMREWVKRPDRLSHRIRRRREGHDAVDERAGRAISRSPARIKGKSEPLSTLFYLPPNPNVVYSAALMSKAEEMFLTGKSPTRSSGRCSPPAWSRPACDRWPRVRSGSRRRTWRCNISARASRRSGRASESPVGRVGAAHLLMLTRRLPRRGLDESSSRAWKDEPAERCKSALLVEEQEVRDLYHVFVDADEIERVLFLLAAPSASRGGGAALHDHDATIAMVSGIEVQRVADVRRCRCPPRIKSTPSSTNRVTARRALGMV